MTTRKIARINRGTGGHWVGDGFPVKTLFSYNSMGKEISPFLLLDYAGPAEFEPSTTPRGVGKHPHRGFETVTIVYQGEVEHKDTAGNSGKIGPGDVQWMTAARGVLHEEMHGHEFTRNGGTIEMVQLWVNLPARHKMSDPGYQAILNQDIPLVLLPDGAGSVRVIAGEYAGVKGAAKTFTPVHLQDMRLNAGHSITIPVTDGYHASLLVLRGKLQIGRETVNPSELVLFKDSGDTIELKAVEDTAILFMSGEPIDEPIAGHGPFVMNSMAEIGQAFADFHAGRFL